MSFLDFKNEQNIDSIFGSTLLYLVLLSRLHIRVVDDDNLLRYERNRHVAASDEGVDEESAANDHRLPYGG